MSKQNESKSNKNDIIITSLESSIKLFIDKLGSGDNFVYPLIIPPLNKINEDILFEIYQDLRKIGKKKKLHILLYSYGGDAHTAFYIGRLFQEYSDELKIYILREAKSAATLISCAADRIIFSEISELGPMDPQFTRNDEVFSPLAIKHILDLLQKQYNDDHSEIFKILAEKLPDPLIIGELLKKLETGKDYLSKLMKARMFKENPSCANKISETLVSGYPDHAYCIDYIEAKEIGLLVEKIDDNLSDTILEIMQKYKKALDKFNYYIEESKDKVVKDGEKNEFVQKALDIHRGLKKVANNIIEYQKEGDVKEENIGQNNSKNNLLNDANIENNTVVNDAEVTSTNENIQEKNIANNIQTPTKTE